MASYSISYTQTTLTFTVTGISAGTECAFWLQKTATGEMILSADKATSTGTSLTKSYNVLEPGTAYACNARAGENTSLLGRKNFTTPGTPTPTRPADWDWSPFIWSGCPYESLSYTVWNQFTARIDAFRKYKGLSEYGFTTAVSGETLLITLFTEAEAAIRAIPGHGTVPTDRALAMSYFDGLASALNAVT